MCRYDVHVLLHDVMIGVRSDYLSDSVTIGIGATMFDAWCSHHDVDQVQSKSQQDERTTVCLYEKTMTILITHRSPLHMAVMASLNSVVAVLLEKGANINAVRLYIFYHLSWSRRNRTIIVSSPYHHSLIDHQIELDSGRTALHMAISVTNLDLVQLLLSDGINISIRDFTGETAIHMAFRMAKTARDLTVLNSIMEHIKEDYTMINSQNSRTGDTILHIAVARWVTSSSDDV